MTPAITSGQSSGKKTGSGTGTVYLGTLAHTRHNPFDRAGALEIVERGAILIDADGKIAAYGDREDILARSDGAERIDHGTAWLLPGFVDGHTHFPQLFATAAHGDQLLDWLKRSVFPAEARLSEPAFAERAAGLFVSRLLASGTTTSLAFGSQFLPATQALFREAERQGLRLIAGLTLMDMEAPPEILTPPETVYEQSETLILRYGGKRMSGYAITPRFALSCSDALMEVCRSLLNAHPDCYVQTHINENPEEISTVRHRFPHTADYLEVYERAGLLTSKTVLAHSIHSRVPELRRMAEHGCAVCHCPASNLYLGSGLFPLHRHLKHGIRVCVGTDIAAGTNFSILDELVDVHHVQKLQGFGLDAAQLLYLGTLAGAVALGLERQFGNFETDKDADLVVISSEDDAYLDKRLKMHDSAEDRLFSLLHLAGAHHIVETVVAGRCVYSRAP